MKAAGREKVLSRVGRFFFLVPHILPVGLAAMTR